MTLPAFQEDGKVGPDARIFLHITTLLWFRGKDGMTMLSAWSNFCVLGILLYPVMRCLLENWEIVLHDPLVTAYPGSQCFTH